MARSSPRVPAPVPRMTVRRAAVLLGALAAVVGVPGAASAAVPASHAAHSAVVTVAARSVQQAQVPRQASVVGAPRSASTARAPGTAQAASTARAASTPQVTTGVCSVPGIGDIGGLLGFCAAGSSGLIGDLNNICQPSVPAPEPATGGIDSLIAPPATASNPSDQASLYHQYGVAGQNWNAYDMQCSDMTSLIGNQIAGMVFDAAKSLDRVTITIYQSAAGEGILSWLTGAVDRLITSLGNAIYFPYLAPVVIIGAIWLAWQGLIRKRATRTIEGTIWMVVACAAAIWLIGRPADFTGLGKGVSDGISQTLDVAFARLPAPAQSSCVPVQRADPQVAVASYGYSSGNSIVNQNADELWTVLVCKPWLDGEFGTTSYATAGSKPTVVNTYARQLLWAQAVATNESPTPAVIQAKENAYVGIAAALKQHNPDVYSLFQGKQWTTRLEIAFAAIFAALIAGLLVLLIAITLIILKLGFLLLLVAGPFFLIVGTHPGFGRVVAIRWVEMLIGVLLKQAAVALVLSVLLYAYSLIMGASDAVLPWALKILMIALVTVAVFIYRKPFAHLFSAVGYGVVGSRERAEVSLREARLNRAPEHARRSDRGDARIRGLPGGQVGPAQSSAGGGPGGADRDGRGGRCRGGACVGRFRRGGRGGRRGRARRLVRPGGRRPRRRGPGSRRRPPGGGHARPGPGRGGPGCQPAVRAAARPAVADHQRAALDWLVPRRRERGRPDPRSGGRRPPFGRVRCFCARTAGDGPPARRGRAGAVRGHPQATVAHRRDQFVAGCFAPAQPWPPAPRAAGQRPGAARVWSVALGSGAGSGPVGRRPARWRWAVRRQRPVQPQ